VLIDTRSSPLFRIRRQQPLSLRRPDHVIFSLTSGYTKAQEIVKPLRADGKPLLHFR